MFYARLKKDVKVAVYYGDKYLQPLTERYEEFDDRFYKQISADERVEIKTQEEMNEVKEEFTQKVAETVNAHWRRAEKEINESSNADFLRAVKKLAIKLEKKKIIQIVEDRMEELEIKE